MASYEGSAAGVLRLAAETLVNATATLADGGVATTSLTRSLCNHRDGSVAGWTPDIDDAALEDWIAAPYPSALEWDTVAMFAAGRDTVHQSVGPAPETAAVDAAVTVLGTLFPATPAATQETVVETLLKAVKATKFGSTKRAATQANIVTALLAVLRTVTGPGRKGAVGKGKVLTGIQELLQVPLILNDPAQRVAAAEAMGRLATAMGASFITSLLKSLLDTILNNQDASTRAGYILALGCVLRHVGGTGVSAHLQSTIGANVPGFSLVPRTGIGVWPRLTFVGAVSASGSARRMDQRVSCLGFWQVSSPLFAATRTRSCTHTPCIRCTSSSSQPASCSSRTSTPSSLWWPSSSTRTHMPSPATCPTR